MQLPYRKPGKFSQMKQDNMMTQAKFDELEKKLNRFKKILLPKAAEEVARLSETGDFSENDAYQNAKGRLRSIHNTITVLDHQINNANIISKKTQNNVVEIGSTITVIYNGKTKIFHILGSSESNPSKGIISYSSPIGSALIGNKIGDDVVIHIQNKKIIYTIQKIQ